MTGGDVGSARLVDRSIAGDDAALRQLVRLYHDRAYRFGRKVCRDGFDADDAVQTAFVILARRPDVQRSDGVLLWLYTVVRNACNAMLRPLAIRLREPLTGSREALDVTDVALTPEAALERFELVTQVHDAIAMLDADSRAVLVLRDIEGLSGDETAKRLSLTTAAMKTRLHRARLAVRANVLQRQARPGSAIA
jgi:RNA polymerase sigma-70 factor, ECF subfamily